MSSKHVRIWVISLAAVALIFGIWKFFVDATPYSALNGIARAHSFPPSFDEHRWVYALALAGLLAISSLATNVLIEDVRFLKSFASKWKEPAKLATMTETAFLLTIVMGFVPDTIILLGWGDPGAPSAATMTDIDRFFDFFCIVPFIVGWLLRARTKRVVQHQLLRYPIPTSLTPSWVLLRPKLFMLLLVVAVSFGVALGK
jgi:hypothetical protein